MSRLLHLWPLLPLVLALAVAWRLGLTGSLAFPALARHQAHLFRLVADYPLAAPAIYVAVYALAVAISLPGATVLTAAGGLLFGIVLGASLAVLGASLGAIALFLIARSALRPLMLHYAGPLGARLRPGIERDGFSYLLALRFIPAFPFWLVNLAPALFGMRLAPYAAATILGILPGTVLFASIGAGLSALLAAGRMPDTALVFSPRVLGPLLGLALISLLPVIWRRIRVRHPERRGSIQSRRD